MNKNLRIWSYKPGSRGARLLADMLDCKIIKHEGSVFKGNKDTVVINWGSSKVSDEVKKCRILNNPKKIGVVQNKKAMLTKLAPFFNVPVFTVDEAEAQGWIEAGAQVIHEDGVYMWNVRPTHILRVHEVFGHHYCEFRTDKADIAPATKDMIRRLVVDVVSQLGLDFCSVDIGWVESIHQAYILNVNTAPELSPELASFYSNWISFQLENVL